MCIQFKGKKKLKLGGRSVINPISCTEKLKVKSEKGKQVKSKTPVRRTSGA